MTLSEHIDLTAFLKRLSNWCLEHRIGSGKILDCPDDTATSIFINGNLARLLICTHELTGEKQYLDEALEWCDCFVSLANPVRTSKGNKAVFWWDMLEIKNIYLADTGTAVMALYKSLPHVDADTRKKYLDILEKYFRFFTEGTDRELHDEGLEPSEGWQIPVGPDKGAFGVGYYYHNHQRLEKRPYTISTAQTGALFCSAMYNLTREEKYRTVALNAANWLVNQISDNGQIAYRINGEVWDDYVYQPMHYSIEGLIAAWMYLDDEDYRNLLRKKTPAMRRLILSLQKPSDYWGQEREYDGQRSINLVSFLEWYNANIQPDKEAIAAVYRFFEYTTSPANADIVGTADLVRVIGFLGLAAASSVQPQIDMRCMTK